MSTPHTKETVLHALVSCRPPSKRGAVRLLKYLVEEKGADITLENADGKSALELAVIHMNTTYIDYLEIIKAGTPMSVADLATSDKWASEEEEEKELRAAMLGPSEGRNAARMMLKEREAQAKQANEAEAKALFDEREAKAIEAAAELLAELDADDRQTAAAAEKKKSKKSTKKKRAGSQQQQAASGVPVDAAAGRGGGVEESKADDKKLAPQCPAQMEEGQEQGQEGEQQQQRRTRPHHGALPGAVEEAAARVAVSIGEMGLAEEEKADEASCAAANAHATTTEVANDGDRKKPAPASVSTQPCKENHVSEEDLEEEKDDFFFDGAPDGLKCPVGFCLMTEAVVAMDGFSYQKFSLEKYIAHWAAKGQPLTSPMTGEPMDGMYSPNQSVRTFVKEYIDQREKEWNLHLAERRAMNKKAK